MQFIYSQMHILECFSNILDPCENAKPSLSRPIAIVKFSDAKLHILCQMWAADSPSAANDTVL